MLKRISPAAASVQARIEPQPFFSRALIKGNFAYAAIRPSRRAARLTLSHLSKEQPALLKHDRLPAVCQIPIAGSGERLVAIVMVEIRARTSSVSLSPGWRIRCLLKVG